MPALFVYRFHGEDRQLHYSTTIRFSGEPLDIVTLPSSETSSGKPALVVSLSREPSTDLQTGSPGMTLLEMDGPGSWTQATFKIQDDGLADGEPDMTVDEMKALLYHTEILRKTHFEDNDEEDGPQDQEAMAIDG